MLASQSVEWIQSVSDPIPAEPACGERCRDRWMKGNAAQGRWSGGDLPVVRRLLAIGGCLAGNALRTSLVLVAMHVGVAAQDIPVPTPRPERDGTEKVPIPTPRPPNVVTSPDGADYASSWRFALSGTPLSLPDAVFLGLRQNRSIKSAYIARVSQKYSLKVAEDRFTPRFSIGGNISRQRISGVDSTTIDVSPGVFVQTPTGAVFDFAWNNSAFLGEADRSFSSIAELSIEQPLLRGAGVTVNTAPVRSAQLAELNNRLRLSATVSETVASIIFSHRDLLLAQEELGLAKTAVGRAEDLIDINAALISAGRMAAVEAVQAEADLEAQKLRLLQAMQGVNNARFALLDLLGLDLSSRIVAQETLTPRQIDPRSDRLITVALMNRPDYLGQLHAIEQSHLGYEVAENEQLWDVDLFVRGRAGEESSNFAPTRRRHHRGTALRDTDQRSGASPATG